MANSEKEGDRDWNAVAAKIQEQYNVLAHMIIDSIPNDGPTGMVSKAKAIAITYLEDSSLRVTQAVSCAANNDLLAERAINGIVPDLKVL